MILIFHWMILQYMQICFLEVHCFYLKKRDQIFVNIKIIERNSYYEGKQKVVKRST